MCVTLSWLMWCFLVLFFKNSYGKCVNYTAIIQCDTLEDLYIKTWLKDVRIFSHEKLTKLTVVPPENAAKIEHLEILKCINDIEHDAFKNFLSLRRLIIQENDIIRIPVGVFQNLNLEYLSFASSNIKIVPVNSFINLSKLNTLSFNNNSLTSVEKNIFNHLPVTKLILSRNRISEIEKFAFVNMTKLKKLVLSENQLTRFVAQESIGGDNHLENLWLHLNQLTEVTGYMLEGLTSLKILNLGSNLISTIEPKAFEETPKLQLLVLSNNSLTILNSNILPSSGLENLKYLYIDHNRLTYLSSNFLFRLSSLRAVSIGGNPWQCSCLDLVFRWLHDNDIELRCDKEYFSGQRPICVISKKSNICVYSYREEDYQTFRNQISKYPPLKLCLL